MTEERENGEQGEGAPAPSGEANLPGIDDEVPNPARLAKRIVEEEETPRSSTEEGAGSTEEEN
jgi:hypothetical protein